MGEGPSTDVEPSRAALSRPSPGAAQARLDPRVAVIDVGSNTARLVVFRASRDGSIRAVFEEKETPRLGLGIGADGSLSRDAIDRGLVAMSRFARTLRALGAARVVAVATSAVRDAPNREEFVDRVAEVAGVRPRILSGEDEGRYAFLGVCHAWRLRDDVVIDLGGGSMQVVYVRGGRCRQSYSRPLGTVRLTDRYLAHDPPRDRELDGLREHVAEELRRLPAAPARARVFVVGGTARALARVSMELTEYPLRAVHGYPLRGKDLKGLSSVLRPMPVARRREVPGIDRTRADVVVAGVATLRKVAERFGDADLIVSAQGIRDGLAYEAAGIAPPRTVDQLLDRAAVVETRSFTFSLAHGQEVERIATDLFDAVQRRFDWGPEERVAVRAAALFHDVGTAIDTWRHALHSAYILRHTPLLGLTHRSAALAVLAVARHEGEPWPEGWRRLWRAVLTDDDLVLAERLGTILYVAERLAGVGVGFRLARSAPRLLVQPARRGGSTRRIDRLEKHIRRGLGLGLSVGA